MRRRLRKLPQVLGVLCGGLIATQVWAADHTVSQKGKKFMPAELSIKVGDTVTFVNDDDTQHNVFSSSATQKFNSGAQKPGDKLSQKFEKAGTVDVRCAIHPTMALKITVK